MYSSDGQSNKGLNFSPVKGERDPEFQGSGHENRLSTPARHSTAQRPSTTPLPSIPFISPEIFEVRIGEETDDVYLYVMPVPTCEGPRFVDAP